MTKKETNIPDAKTKVIDNSISKMDEHNARLINILFNPNKTH